METIEEPLLGCTDVFSWHPIERRLALFVLQIWLINFVVGGLVFFSILFEYSVQAHIQKVKYIQNKQKGCFLQAAMSTYRMF